MPRHVVISTIRILTAVLVYITGITVMLAGVRLYLETRLIIDLVAMGIVAFIVAAAIGYGMPRIYMWVIDWWTDKYYRAQGR